MAETKFPDPAAISRESADLLLAEHARISSLYEHNSGMGDRYLANYMTSITLAIALVAGGQYLLPDPNAQLSLVLGGVLIIVLIGEITFARVLERRVRGTEYLRAINRIHCYFARRDPNVSGFLFWPACDDRPRMDTKGTILGGIRDITAILTSLSYGFAGGWATLRLAPPWPAWVAAVVGVAMGGLSYIAHRYLGHRALSIAEKRLGQYILFRSPEPQRQIAVHSPPDGAR